MFNKKFYFPLIILFFFSQILLSQVHVDANGTVGIGTDTPDAGTKLHLTSDGLTVSNQELLNIEYTGSTMNSNHKGISSVIDPAPGYGYGGYLLGGYMGLYSVANMSGYGYRYAVKAIAYGGTGYSYGVYSKSSSGSVSRHYGLYSKAEGSATTNYGVYAYASSANTNYGIWAGASGTVKYAGYFSGDVVVTGTMTDGVSDEKLKENINDIGNALENIKKMKPKTYTYKQDQKVKLSKGKKYGLLAQDLEKIYPEMVTEIVQPVIDEENDNDDEEGTDTVKKDEFITYKAITYNQLIPILVQGLQEQQKIIEDLQKNQEEMLKRIEQLEKK